MSRVHLCAVVFILACGPGRVEGDSAEAVESGEGTDGETGAPADMLSDADKDELDALGDELQQIAEAAVAWFEASELPHRCPHPIGSPEGGPSLWTPDLSTNCNVGPDHRCVPSEETGGGYYDSSWWTYNAVWIALGFQKTEPHLCHYNFEATNTLDGYGACTFTVTAAGDLDDDALFSTYSIRGTIDENGAVIEPLEITDPHE